MRVLLTGGGTAGHINPSLSIGDIIKDREPDSVIEYIGTPNGIEGRLVPKRGIKLHGIKVTGLSRSLSPSNIKSLLQAFSALKKCKKLIKSFKPDVVIGTGGYVCWAPIKAAASLGIPTVLHESNAEPGFAVRSLKKDADLILVNFEGTKKLLSSSSAVIERVGMPVSKDFKTDKKIDRGNRKRDVNEVKKSVEANREPSVNILSFGGSLGAHTINLCALKLADKIASGELNVKYKHSSGTREYESVMKAFSEKGYSENKNIEFSEYIYNMPEEMRKADIIICRSGASTLAELAVAGKAAILIPSPNVTADQQRKNARQLSEKNAAVVIEDSEAEEKIAEVVEKLVKDALERKKLSEAVKQFAVDDCDEKIYRSIKKLVDKNE